MVSRSSRQLTREPMKIVSLGFEDHGLRSHAVLKRLVPKSGVLPPDTFF
jgi:hypothetical protein